MRIAGVSDMDNPAAASRSQNCFGSEADDNVNRELMSKISSTRKLP